MDAEHTNDNQKTLRMDVEGLTPQQIRLLKRILSLLTHTMKTEDEADYFLGGQELMKSVAQVIKTAQFSHSNKTIAYGVQALEFSYDALAELIHSDKINNYDN